MDDVKNSCDVEFVCTAGDGCEPRIFRLKQQMPSDEFAPLFSDAWTGSVVWACSYLFSRKLESLDLTGQTVLELGAGCGLCGLIACAQSNARVVSTDQTNIVPLVQQNVAANLSKEEAARFRTLPLSWGTGVDSFLQVEHNSSFDVIIASDVINPIYGQESWKLLADTISRLSSCDSQIYLAYQHRGPNGTKISAAVSHFEPSATTALDSLLGSIAALDPLLNAFWKHCANANLVCTCVQQLGEGKPGSSCFLMTYAHSTQSDAA
mmetsp:Transcript_41090/g.80607  ORF Transcript_41090/g.80607 Transcript_41090/m.80607 type:complete len:265 (+) Transcript_41090:136-930(+)|eukprot:CAMPEP_0175092570 /NCGR_PEP_ID=MMETSP0086_2-20121207/2534_1 /TAXON_ID=136419 /ORGANISM="Unknown Unknown, Strain D1" /LENGTH=264 /DNA_ID=CAMNT_0016365443 /DNA_START=63 /DNA_END=857 /DNA_ORIENTATION=+